MTQSKSPINKRKIINDPVYGLIQFPTSIIYDIVEHPWFQRLRRIKQLGLTDMVYPGAVHTRFHHAIGATHLMEQAIDTLRQKGHSISGEEATGAYLAILLHDMGHGPFSHSLEHQIVEVHHEELSLLFMERLNKIHKGLLDVTIQIFKNNYPKGYLHQLVSSQLDVDRLDYLRRDSFFTGVSEGVVSSDRIIKMLDVSNDKLVVEKKGIYSIEKFIIARRLMYWQVYLHKAGYAAELMLSKILQRAKFLARNGEKIEASKPLLTFLNKTYTLIDFKNKPELLNTFALLDDTDIISSIKAWTNHPDKVLSILSSKLIARELFRNNIQENPFEHSEIMQVKQATAKKYDLTMEEVDFLVSSDKIENSAYTQETDKILIKDREGQVTEIVNVADMLNIRALSNTVSKHFLCYPKDINIQ